MCGLVVCKMSNALAVIIDMDGRGTANLQHVVEAITFYVTSLGLSQTFPSCLKLAVIAAFPHGAEYIVSGDWRDVSTLRNRIETNIQEAADELETPLAQAVSKALCFVRKHRSQKKHDESLARIILFEHSLDSVEFSSQSVPLSNCGWAASSLARINLVSLGSATPAAALVSLCQKSGGTHIPFKHTQSLGELVQALLFHLTSHETILDQLKVRPALATQHMGAVCACHNKSLDKGYVCSICLSIYCTETSGTCAVCGSRIRREAKDEQPVSAQTFSKLSGPTSNSIFL